MPLDVINIVRVMVSARIIERKLRSTKVPCCSIILFSSEGMKKTYLNLLLFFSLFYNSGLFMFVL